MKNKKGINVFVGLSGGVDSSVAAALLCDEGYNVTGVFMQCFNVDGCAERDAEDARRVADHLDIPFYTFDFEQEYKDKVVEYMVDGYEKGITPNPDVMCNSEIKFGIFLEKASKLGADYVATGHYVQIKEEDNNFKLFEGVDNNKDQSYFLWKLNQNQLKHCLFPVGKYKKPKIRDIAKKYDLPTAEKKDSQGICFLGEVSLADFLSNYISPEKGDIITTKGKKIGEHDGIYFYTIGQRHGLDLDKKNKKLGISGEHKTKPHYVTEKKLESNILVVAEGSDNPALFKDSVELYDINLINPLDGLEDGLNVMARIRYRQYSFKANLIKENDKYKLLFSHPQKFVASGQSAVFYSEDGEMLGGGVIK